jgi:hypothetical protein
MSSNILKAGKPKLEGGFKMADRKEKLFVVGTHRYSFRAGTPAEVIGVAMFTPEGMEPRPGFILRFEDGTEDTLPIFAASSSIEKNPHFEFITEADIHVGRIPEVTH